MGKIVAIGGYIGNSGNASMASLPIDKEIVHISGKKRPRALFIPTASDDAEKYIRWFHQMYGEKLHCKTDVLLLYKEKLNRAQIQKKVLSADIIYVGGGNTLKMINRWKKSGVGILLRKAYKKNIVLAGVSAGSICWFNYGVSDSRQFKNPKSKEYIRVSGLGIIPCLHTPHFRSRTEDKGFRTKGLKKISKRTPGIAIAIEDGCALVILDNTYRIISFSKGTKAYKTFWGKGEYVEFVLPQKGTTQSLLRPCV